MLCGFDVINKDFIRGAVKPQIAKFLEAAKAKVKPEIMERMQGVTGVVGILETGRPGPTVGFRCELDCVPVTETSDPEHIPNKEGFASQNPGYMHACGHDGHQAVLMGLASWLAANKDKLCGTVKLIFEPGEEGSRAAARSLKADCLMIWTTSIADTLAAISRAEKWLRLRKNSFAPRKWTSVSRERRLTPACSLK